MLIEYLLQMMETVVFYLPTISPIPTVLKEKNRDKTISRKHAYLCGYVKTMAVSGNTVQIHQDFNEIIGSSNSQ